MKIAEEVPLLLSFNSWSAVNKPAFDKHIWKLELEIFCLKESKENLNMKFRSSIIGSARALSSCDSKTAHPACPRKQILGVRQSQFALLAVKLPFAIQIKLLLSLSFISTGIEGPPSVPKIKIKRNK